MGGLSFFIELIALLSLNATGMHRTLAVAISFWIGFVVALLLQKLFAFRDYRRKPKVILKQTAIFSLLVGFNYLFTIGIVSLFPEEYLLISRTIAIVLVTFWNYFLYKNIVFKNGKTSTPVKKLSLKTSIANIGRLIFKHKLSLLFYAGCSLVVILFFWQYIGTGGKTLMGDFDYYSQLYEAFRISVLEYGQFPAWNPWLSGGVPLWQNPQFGLISLQSLLVLPFGSIEGMKITYIIYALVGFWGMFILARKSFGATKFRAALVSFIWIFCGFFAGHGITHFTFTSFFFLPWIVYFIIERSRIRYAWLGLGATMAIIALSSVHYATMFTPLIIAAYIGLSLIRVERKEKGGWIFGINVRLKDLYFFLKTGLVFVLLAGWQFIATYSFVSNNERLITNGGEEYLTPIGIFKAIFMPVDISLVSMPKVTWGWGEYSMYIGIAALIILALIALRIVKLLIRKKKLPITRPYWVLVAVVVGVMGMLLALGDFASYSPFHLLHELPGFSQTRVPSRWMIYTVFAILLLIASWKAQSKTINVLLALCVVELFITFGPVRLHGQDWVSLPKTTFSSEFTQHDNNFKHTQRPDDPLSYYWYTTRLNVGQVHADDSIINTLSSTPLLESSRCANNTNPQCSFVRSDNGRLEFWSPNKIIVKRTGEGNIRLNLNVDAGWRINDEYLYAQNKKLDPKHEFILSGDNDTYTLEYAPKFSPSWITWKLSRIL